MTAHRRSRGLYRVLLLILPGDMRAQFGRDMEQLFADRIREASGEPVRVAALWVAAGWDVLRAATNEWAARARAIGTETIREATTMDGWMQDLRFGVRTLLRQPGFSLAALATLALGIGANVSIFSVVNAVLLRPLPYPDSDRLVVLWTVNERRGVRERGFDHPDLRLLQDEVPGLALSGLAESRPTLTGLGDPEVIETMRVTDGLIGLLGYRPELGRDLERSDDIPDGPRVAVISHAFWTDRMGADSTVIGRSIALNGTPWEIVGVGPAGFDFPGDVDVWTPRRHDESTCGHGCRVMDVIGRLAPGADPTRVQAELDALGARLEEEFTNSHDGVRFEVQRLRDERVADVKLGLWVLLAAVGTVLLIACANVANLMLARATERRAEAALRATLGASRVRIVRQLLTESTVLALAAGAVGVALSVWGTRVFAALAPSELPSLAGASLDPSVLAFAAGVVVLVAGTFGALPAAYLSRQSLASALAAGRRSSGSRAGLPRSLLLTGEVGMSVGLLLVAGLLLRTLGELRDVDFGFASENVERFRLSAPDSRYDSLGVGRFFDELETRVGALPGVLAAGTGFGVPLAPGSIGTTVSLMDRPEVPPPERPSAAIRPSSPGFLDASGMTLVAGRWFTRADQRDAPPVAVINARAAALFFPAEEAVGKRIHTDVTWGFDDEPSRTVVGVVADVRTVSATEAPDPAVYLPNAQFGANSMYVWIRTAPGVESVIPAARRVLRGIDPAIAITDVTRIEDVVAREYAATTFYLMLLSSFSLLAVVLAAVGLYGVVAYVVSRRTREIGIRMALGARARDVVAMVLLQGARPALAGVALGLLASWWGGDLVGSLLYGVEPHDPRTLASVTALVLVVTLTASLLPARRASRVPPAAALRSE